MNRYRNAPGVRGPSKATASTLCQKCLKRGHYSYECKVTAQERPYLARPSRTQQLQNPKLRPQLTNNVLDDASRTQGTADALLAQREEGRGRKRELEDIDPSSNRSPAAKRSRSISSDSASSVSTISTNQSRSASPRRERYDERREAKSVSHSYSRKRRHSDSSSGYSVSSYSSRERSRTRTPERNIRRRRRESSPKERGRPRDNSRPASRRERSRSYSIDQSRIARERRPTAEESAGPGRSYTKQRGHERKEDGRDRAPPPRRERSLSPYSKRIALTQAMNMDR
ncbi:zinc finger CCHC-type containing 10 [Aspergillus stella-maris]|uniref:zinc finger CCHC-type containing 10 n=1 Tax=Aspergillus stella-maris TaxID=1810926 RepID=UPI003CCD3B11